MNPAEGTNAGISISLGVRSGMTSKDMIHVYYDEELERDVDDLK